MADEPTESDTHRVVVRTPTDYETPDAWSEAVLKLRPGSLAKVSRDGQPPEMGTVGAPSQGMVPVTVHGDERYYLPRDVLGFQESSAFESPNEKPSTSGY